MAPRRRPKRPRKTTTTTTASESSSQTATNQHSGGSGGGGHRRHRRRQGNLKFVTSLFSRYRHVKGWTPNLITSSIFLVMIRILGALISPMSDCDESFNYWEPLHYMLYGWGFQTWEYSPKFALRSYAFLIPYGTIARIATNRGLDKISTFFTIRIVQAIFSALAELSLYDSVVWRFGSERSCVFLFLLCGSPGIFRAAPELLPSSFAMIALTAAWSRWLVGEFILSVFFVALASLFGWIYVAAAALPMALHILFRRGFGRFLFYALISAIPIVVPMVLIDSHYYGNTVLVPLRHLLYNVFPVQGAGPELFGVESWTFYALNLILNVPFVVPLIMLLPLQMILQGFGTRVWGDARDAWSRFIFLTGPLVMAALLIVVPHKEERFLAPLYPMFCLFCAVLLVDWVHLVTRLGCPKKVRVITFRLLTSAIVMVSLAFGASRMYMQSHAFGAPFKLYKSLARDKLMLLPTNGPDVNVCIGKEWHRFPSHFFIPNRRVKVRFIPDGFHGLLPKYYDESAIMGSRIHQSGMNMFNNEDPEQWFNKNAAEGCHFVVDLDLSHRSNNDDDKIDKTNDRSNITIPSSRSRTIFAHRFLDIERSPAGLRAFYIPTYTDQLVYGRYVIVRNKGLSL